jgi:hypothetical protein
MGAPTYYAFTMYGTLYVLRQNVKSYIILSVFCNWRWIVICCRDFWRRDVFYLGRLVTERYVDATHSLDSQKGVSSELEFLKSLWGLGTDEE